MRDKLKNDLQHQLESLYPPLEAANISYFFSRSEADERVVQQLEEKINWVVDALIALDALEAQV